MVSSPNSVRFLTVIALWHKWNLDASFVIVTAYFDDSDTHGDQPTIIMSAFLGHAYQWRRFELKLARIQAMHRFQIFHAKDFKSRNGEFAGWTNEQCVAVISDLSDLVTNTLTEGISVHLEWERYINEYRAQPVPKKMRLDSQYGVCFRACLGRIFTLLAERGYRDTLDVVIERGHHNALNCETIFHDMKKMYVASDLPFMGTFSLQNKSECMPLMVADMLAAAHSMMRARGAAGTLSVDQYARERRRGKASLAFIELAPDALWDMKARFEEDRQQQIAAWQARRTSTASLAASSKGRP